MGNSSPCPSSFVPYLFSMPWRVEESEPLSRPSGIMTTVAWVLREMGLVATLDAMLAWDPKQCKLSPGVRLLALVLSVLFDRTALWRVDRVFARQDLPILFGPGVEATDFNDDALGRALDKLAQARPAHVFASVAANVWAHEQVPFDSLHGDTSAVALYGAYEDPGPDVLQIVRGYSKDHRSDLKQIGLGFVSSPEGIPLLGDIHDGNLSDNTWNHRVIKELAKALPEETLRSILYCADCKVVTPENLLAMDKGGIHWLSRLPETYDAATTLKLKAWAAGGWDEPAAVSPRPPAARYRLCVFSDVALSANPEHPLAELRYRCVVVHSTALEARALARQRRLVAEERQALNEALTDRQTFPTTEEAMAAGSKLLTKLKLRYHTLQIATAPIAVPGKRPKGRPRKDAPSPPPVIRFIWDPTVAAPGPEQLQKEIQLRSTFVLVTNDPRRSPRELLATYKRQQTAVEIPFHQTKALPVAPMFLDRPERVRAMGYVLLMAYTAFAVLQRRVRHALAETPQPLSSFENRRNPAPTGAVILAHLAEVHTDIVQENGDTTRIVKVSRTARHLLELLGVPFEAFVLPHASSP